MKLFFFISVAFLTTSFTSSNLSLCRSIYFSEPSEEQALRLQATAESISENEALKLAYLGVAQSMLAEYAGNPFSKLSTFNKGKEQLELAIKKAPENPEIRVLRLGVQLNVPGFLMYDSNIEEDVELISKSISTGAFKEDATYRRNVISYLLEKAPLTPSQTQTISALK